MNNFTIKLFLSLTCLITATLQTAQLPELDAECITGRTYELHELQNNPEFHMPIYRPALASSSTTSRNCMRAQEMPSRNQIFSGIITQFFQPRSCDASSMAKVVSFLMLMVDRRSIRKPIRISHLSCSSDHG